MHSIAMGEKQAVKFDYQSSSTLHDGSLNGEFRNSDGKMETCTSSPQEMLLGRDVTNRSVSHNRELHITKSCTPSRVPVALEQDVNRRRRRNDSGSFISEISSLEVENEGVQVVPLIQPHTKKSKSETRDDNISVGSQPANTEWSPASKSSSKNSRKLLSEQEYEDQTKREKSESFDSISKACQAVPSVWSSKYLQKYLRRHGVPIAIDHLESEDINSTTSHGSPDSNSSNEDEKDERSEDVFTFELDSVTPIPLDELDGMGEEVAMEEMPRHDAIVTTNHSTPHNHEEALDTSSPNVSSTHHEILPNDLFRTDFFSEIITSPPQTQMDHLIVKGNQNLIGEREDQSMSADNVDPKTHLGPPYSTSAFAFAHEWWKMD